MTNPSILLDEEFLYFNDPTSLAKGTSLSSAPIENNPSAKNRNSNRQSIKGLFIFSLSDIPQGQVFWTDRNTTLERISETEVLLGGMFHISPIACYRQPCSLRIISIGKKVLFILSKDADTNTKSGKGLSLSSLKNSFFQKDEKKEAKPKPVQPISAPVVNNSATSSKSSTLEDKMNEQMGSMVSKMATNEKAQDWAGQRVSSVAKNEKAREAIGNAIASGTDNKLLAYMATSKSVQNTLGSVVASAATNKQVQQAVGKQIAKSATDKQTQKQTVSVMKKIVFN